MMPPPTTTTRARCGKTGGVMGCGQDTRRPRRAAGAAGTGPGPARPRAARPLRRALLGRGLDVRDRLVLHAGPHAGPLLRQALAAGAWWAHGWDDPAAASRAAGVAMALGFTRMEVCAVEARHGTFAVPSPPAWLHPHLAESIVVLSAIGECSRMPPALMDAPWRALVYEGRPGETPEQCLRSVRPFLAPGWRGAQPIDPPSRDTSMRRLVTLVRDAQWFAGRSADCSVP
jgi:hypothetical protein